VRAEVDHLVITAPSLDEGTDYVRDQLGVAMEPGGSHPLMGTHNRLVRLGENTYLEVLAIDPACATHTHPRWFGLDHVCEPGLAAWVARVDDIDAAVARASVPMGDVRRISRGDLEWRITVPRGGRLLLDGVAPLLIQWLKGSHPASRLPDAGCSLERLRGVHREENPQSSLEFDSRWSFHRGGPDAVPVLEATIRTPSGMRTLHTRPRG
jgi:hypothetical protein